MESATALREVTVVRKPKKVEPQPIVEVVPEPKRGFLCISRTTKTPHNSLMIGDVEVVILEVRGQQVKLGISAPKSVSIERKERKKESDERRETVP